MHLTGQETRKQGHSYIEQVGFSPALIHCPREKSRLTDDKRNSRRDDSFNGTRKLIRPRLPLGGRRREPISGEEPLTNAAATEASASGESTHAEAFYFQKQIQQQTEMTIILDDSEELHGVIQWFDKHVIKLRTNRGPVMIYKSSIKYLYKTSEGQPRTGVMK